MRQSAENTLGLVSMLHALKIDLGCRLAHLVERASILRVAVAAPGSSPVLGPFVACQFPSLSLVLFPVISSAVITVKAKI